MRDFWHNFVAFSLAIFVHVLLLATLWFGSGLESSNKSNATTDCINPALSLPVETVNEIEVEDAIARMEKAEAIKRQGEIDRNADIRDRKAELEKITEEQLQEMNARETALLAKEAEAQAKAEAALNAADHAQQTAAAAQAAAQAAALSEAAATQKLADLKKRQTAVEAQRKASEHKLAELALKRETEIEKAATLAQQKDQKKADTEAELAQLQAALKAQKQRLEVQRKQAKKERQAHEAMLKTKQLDKLKKQQAKAAAVKKQQAKAAARKKQQAKAATLKKQQAKTKADALRKQRAKAKADALKKQRIKAKAEALKKRQAKAKADALRKQQAIAAQKQAAAQNTAAAAQATIRAKSKMQRHLNAIKGKIPKYWVRPQNTPDGLQCTLSISTSVTGQVLNVRTITSSGNAQFDRSAVAATWAATPLPVPSDKNLYHGIMPDGSKTDGFNVIQMNFRPR